MQVSNERGLAGKWLGALLRSPWERERESRRRLRELGARIEKAPASYSHRVLRGELYLERGECERARADFETALDLTGNMDDSKSWNIVEQVMRDRALYGMRVIKRRIPSLVESWRATNVED